MGADTCSVATTGGLPAPSNSPGAVACVAVSTLPEEALFCAANGTSVGYSVGVSVGEGVAVAVGVSLGVGVSVGVEVGVAVDVRVGVMVPVAVGVAAGVLVEDAGMLSR